MQCVISCVEQGPIINTVFPSVEGVEPARLGVGVETNSKVHVQVQRQ